jgi:hypothetical protein
MLEFIRHMYHDEFRAPGVALGCPRAVFDHRFRAREDFGPEAALRAEESAQQAS